MADVIKDTLLFLEKERTDAIKFHVISLVFMFALAVSPGLIEETLLIDNFNIMVLVGTVICLIHVVLLCLNWYRMRQLTRTVEYVDDVNKNTGLEYAKTKPSILFLPFILNGVVGFVGLHTILSWIEYYANSA